MEYASPHGLRFEVILGVGTARQEGSHLQTADYAASVPLSAAICLSHSTSWFQLGTDGDVCPYEDGST